MPTPTDRITNALDTANRVFTLGERLAAVFGAGNPKARASLLCRRAVNKRRAADKARSAARAKNLRADAAAFEAKADILDPPLAPAVCVDA